jgi:hypothetical protein
VLRVSTLMALKERTGEASGRGFDYIYIRKLTGKVRNGML